jgi:hypothetical protein
MFYGMAVGPTTTTAEEDDDDDESAYASRTVKAKQRVSFCIGYAITDCNTSSLSTQRKTSRRSGHWD